MSLINQALRKAQRDRTPNRMADSGSGDFAAAAPAGGNGMKPGLVIGLVVAVALLLGLVAGLSVVLLSGNDANPIAQQSPPPPDKVPAQENSSTPPPAPVTTTSDNLEPIATRAEPSTTSPVLEREATPTVVEELRKAREAAEAKATAEAKTAEAEAAAAAKAAEEAAARAAAKPSKDIIDWLTQAKVTGVMLSETNSKAILNGKTYAVGEYVNYTLGLKIMVIQEKRILFVDENGKKYMKRL